MKAKTEEPEPSARARKVTKLSFRRMRRFEASKPRKAKRPVRAAGIKVPKWASPSWLMHYRERQRRRAEHERIMETKRRAQAEQAAEKQLAEKRSGVLARARKKLRGGVKQKEPEA